jgi:hypothetical protein
MSETTTDIYRRDLLEWRFKRLKKSGESYTTISKRSGVSKATLCDMVRGTTRPFPETITKTFEAFGLNPKYALDFDLKPRQFSQAVL